MRKFFVGRSKTAEPSPPPKGGKPEATPSPATGRSTTRETVESIVIAFVLAFLFRTFEAEAFVIPTGSMAPTLQGRHKDVTCPECGYEYRATASNEADEDAQMWRQQLSDPRFRGDKAQVKRMLREKDVVAVTCPQCRYTLSVDPEAPGGENYPGYNGDRILVAKFPYEFAEPERWDVIVFKFPGDAKVNYIKRLVGLPNERIRIQHGDIFSAPLGDNKFSIVRKPHAKLLAMAQIVHDNDVYSPTLQAASWPERWQQWSDDQTAGWKTVGAAPESRAFEIDGADKQPQWLRYRHYVPTYADWDALLSGASEQSRLPRAQLITDFYAYNTSQDHGRAPGRLAVGYHWVGDLMLEAEVTVRSPDGIAMLDLVEGGRHFRCSIDVATGLAKLSIDGEAKFHPVAQTAVRGPGTYHLKLSNFDDQLLLWVDDRLAEFNSATTYDGHALGNDRPRSIPEEAGDLAPAGIGSQGASLAVNHIRIWRDIYYIADETRISNGPITDYEYPGQVPLDAEKLADLYSSPQRWDRGGARGESVFENRKTVTFDMQADQFFALGDNSPFSKDSRLWGDDHWVSRELLIGKALFIYWPHSWPTRYSVHIPLGSFDFHFPFVPNFGRMGLVR